MRYDISMGNPLPDAKRRDCVETVAASNFKMQI